MTQNFMSTVYQSTTSRCDLIQDEMNCCSLNYTNIDNDSMLVIILCLRNSIIRRTFPVCNLLETISNIKNADQNLGENTSKYSSNVYYSAFKTDGHRLHPVEKKTYIIFKSHNCTASGRVS